MSNTITRWIGGKLVTLTIVRVDPRNGNVLYHGDNGRNYIKSRGVLRRAYLSVG